MADRPEKSWEEVADKDFSLQPSAFASMFVTFFNMSCLGVIQVGGRDGMFTPQNGVAAYSQSHVSGWFSVASPAVLIFLSVLLW